MGKSGKVIKWDPGRGFGFIRDDRSQSDVFFHVRDFRSPVPPAVGITVFYDDIHVGGKGPRAIAVKPAVPVSTRPHAPKGNADAPESWKLVNQQGERRGSGAATGQKYPRSGGNHGVGGSRSDRSSPGPRGADRSGSESSRWPAVLLIAVWLGLLARGMAAARLPPVTPGIAVLLSLATFMAYWVDKHAAQSGKWRTAESTLHLFALAGGWPGAWAAQQILRHKSRKQPFRQVFVATAVLNCALLAAWLFWWPAQQFQDFIR
ncbi:MAG: DUF1294 domain-containing protein [Comamonadaceae bacterium]|nr:MAG: DUF1294 domain-containing protein [Comamonadaceae bacterium]